MNINEVFHGPNSAYIIELYESFQKDPDSVDPKARKLFERWKLNPGGNFELQISTTQINSIVGAVNLAQSIRAFGHLNANIDPLGSEPPGDPSLHPENHFITNEDLNSLPSGLIGGPIVKGSASTNALETIEKLRSVYCSTTGYDYDHIYEPEERQWLRSAAELGWFRPPNEPINEKLMLQNLTQVESLERFLHRIFPGKFRFSIEGVDMLVPMLKEIVGMAAESAIHNIVLGMAHRGRLNVLHHVMNKPYRDILVKFKDPILKRVFGDYMGWTGDVKYHEGARLAVHNGKPIEMMITLAPNPSHLESVNPIVEGMTRAAGTNVDQPGEPIFDPAVSLPIIVHGDAAFPGQGIVAETLNLSRLRGYQTGGTLNIITNNQLGYTTHPEDSRSTLYASDLAKGFEIPIVHVNADDPEACIEAARLAFKYIQKFHKDFLIDLVGYRRHGHNEADEPSFTQPVLYKTIDTHPTVRELWANTLIERKIIDPSEPQKLIEEFNETLHRDFESIGPSDKPSESKQKPPRSAYALKAKTKVKAAVLKQLNSALLEVPQGFAINSKLKRGWEKRRNALENKNENTIDWAMAEDLAFASILADGTSIRITGQDTNRGTFSHRHSVIYDSKTGEPYTPLQAIPQAKAAFEIYNSPLSENSCIGFEYGYNIQEPKRLVIWEAQYGDFINGAQTIIDEYLVSARAKWGQTPSLILLLPHAYEGQGPDHSSGRVERFLESAAEINMRIANCTTASQYFHLLRRQAVVLEKDPLPLIVLTPKGLLRNPLVFSSLGDLSEGMWLPVIDDPVASKSPKSVKRIILCSGKIYIDMINNELREKRKDVAIVRIEQLYPLRAELIEEILENYTGAKELVWLQEEPENMGAWEFMIPRLRRIIARRFPLHYIGRRRNSSPAEGLSSMHKINQETLIRQAYTVNTEMPNIEDTGIIWVKNV